jgi:hypothetical protein
MRQNFSNNNERNRKLLVFLLLFIFAIFLFSKINLSFSSENILASIIQSVLVDMTNENRSINNLKRLQTSPVLSQAAKLKAEDMAIRGYFSHKSPDGLLPWYWFDKVGYDYEYAGENLALNFGESREVEKAWMDSPAHKANLLHEKYSEIGIGIAEGEYQGQKTIFIVQFFASPAIAPCPSVALCEGGFAKAGPSAKSQTKVSRKYRNLAGAVIEAGLLPFKGALEKKILEKLLGGLSGQIPILPADTKNNSISTSQSRNELEK